MVKVKLFGTLQLDTGVKELDVEAKSVQDLYAPVYEAVKAKNENPAVSLKDLKDCIVAVNGKKTNRHAKLHDGDVVYIMTAVAGG